MYRNWMRAILYGVVLSLAACGGDSAGVAQLTPALATSKLRAAAVLDASAVMTWAESHYPAFFPGHPSNKTSGPYTYRSYSNGNLLGLDGQNIYVMGTSFGTSPQFVGTIGQFTCQVAPGNCAAAGTTMAGTVIGRGTAIAGAAVTLRDAAGVTRSTTANSSGAYSLNAGGLAPPFIVTATGTDALGVPVSMVSPGNLSGTSLSQRMNVTPWTTALAGMLSPTGHPADLNPTTDRTRILGSLTNVITYTRTMLAPTLDASGVPSTTYDPVTAPLVADGTGISLVYVRLEFSITTTGTMFAADTTAPACSTAIQSHCVRYANPGTQTTTNPNLCGSDIATGAPIPCDSSLPITGTPSPITIDVNQAYQFGCTGCIFWGSPDNYAAPPTQTPLEWIVVGDQNWYAHFSVTACAAGQCFSSGVSVAGTSYDAQSTCTQAAAAIASAFNGTAGTGISYSFVCNQTP